MNTTIIFILLAMAVVGIIVWAWSFRHRKTKSTTTDNVSWRSADPNSSTAELPELLEVLPIVPDIPQLSLPTSGETPILVITQPSLGENLVAAPEVEEIQSASFPSPIIRIEDGPEIPDASRSEPSTSESSAIDVQPDVEHRLVNEPSAESAMTNEVLIESGNPTETVTVDTLTHDYIAPDAHEIPQPSLPKTDPLPTPPTYHPPTPPVPKITSIRKQTSRSTQNDQIDLRLRVQLVFGRGGVVKTLAVIPDRREGMPDEIEVSDEKGMKRLVELSEDYYEPIPLSDPSNALHLGIQWRGRGTARLWRWILSKRQLYVLASGDKFGLRGFVSIARLRLNTSHVILARTVLRDQVLIALADAGCATPNVNDDNTLGVPSGWILFSNVTPTRAVPMQEEADIFNALRPAHEIKPNFMGGIRLERNTWLAGFPPRIRFTGESGPGDNFQVMIDGAPARLATDDGVFEAPGWDAEGEHRLWFADRSETYSLCSMNEGWDFWPAHDFGVETVICGAGIYNISNVHRHHVRIPAANPLILGARPGEIFKCRVRHDVHSKDIIVSIPFAPVWALPINPTHANKRLSWIVLLNVIEPTSITQHIGKDRDTDREIREWVAAVNDAGRKQLALADANEDGRYLWRRYRGIAKRLWKMSR